MGLYKGLGQARPKLNGNQSSEIKVSRKVPSTLYDIGGKISFGGLRCETEREFVEVRAGSVKGELLGAWYLLRFSLNFPMAP